MDSHPDEMCTLLIIFYPEFTINFKKLGLNAITRCCCDCLKWETFPKHCKICSNGETVALWSLTQHELAKKRMQFECIAEKIL